MTRLTAMFPTTRLTAIFPTTRLRRDHRCAARGVAGKQRGLGVARGRLAALASKVDGVSPEHPGLRVVGQVEIEIAQDAVAVRLLTHRKCDFHAPEEIP